MQLLGDVCAAEELSAVARAAQATVFKPYELGATASGGSNVIATDGYMPVYGGNTIALGR